MMSDADHPVLRAVNLANRTDNLEEIALSRLRMSVDNLYWGLRFEREATEIQVLSERLEQAFASWQEFRS